jgi:hypothetical protein
MKREHDNELKKINFSGYFTVSEEELKELYQLLNDAKKNGIRLEDVLRG